MKRSFIREILEHTNSDTISFAGGLPMESLFPLEALQRSANRVLENASVLQYGASTGQEALKVAIAKRYSLNGFETSPENILITSGSQQALDIITRYHGGKSITIEAPSYLGAMNIFLLNSLRQDAITLECDGINIEAFEESFRRTNLAYLIPDFQNPTGLSYGQEKRERVANIIKNHGLLIEDAPYSELYFDAPSQSISSMLPQQSYHLGTFSKTLAPALRMGWIRADKKLLEPLIAYKEAMDLHSNGLSQAILVDYLSDEKMYALHLQKLRDTYEHKMRFFATSLRSILPLFEFIEPKGGMFIYGKLSNINTSKLIKKALEEGVVFVPGAEFYGQNQRTDEIRFNFSLVCEKEVVLGLERIASLVIEL
jgi:2-aminoadipate transaminase